jgi:hypothetical protein
MKDNDQTNKLLIRAVQVTWEALPEEVLNKLAETIQHRATTTKEARGWYTKYWGVENVNSRLKFHMKS